MSKGKEIITIMTKIVLIGHGFSLVNLIQEMDLSDTNFYANDGGMINADQVPNIFEKVLADNRTLFHHDFSHDFLLSSEMNILDKDSLPSCIQGLNAQYFRNRIDNIDFYLFKTNDCSGNQVVILIPAIYNVGIKLSWIKNHVSEILKHLEIKENDKIVYHWLACMSEVTGMTNDEILQGCNEGDLTILKSIVG